MRYWDEGWGKLWIYRESLGPIGIVRAHTWEEAYQYVVDEIMDDADESNPDSYARSYDKTADEGELAEGVQYRSGVPSNDGLNSDLAQEDLNGSSLDLLRSFRGARREQLLRYLDVKEIRAAFRR